MIESHTTYTTGPVHNKKAAGTRPGIHGNRRINEKNNGCAVAFDSRNTLAAAAKATIIAGAIQSGGRNPKREAVSAVATARDPIDIHAAKPAEAAAMSGTKSPCYHTAQNVLRHNMLNIDFINGLERIVGPTGILRDPNELLTYESDGLARLQATPGCVVLPDTAEEVQQIVRLCHAHTIPFVARGHGTGLSGGALPRARRRADRACRA